MRIINRSIIPVGPLYTGLGVLADATSDPDYVAGMAVVNRAKSSPRFNDFGSAELYAVAYVPYANLVNQLGTASNSAALSADDRTAINYFATALARFLDTQSPAAAGNPPPPAQTSAAANDAIAAVTAAYHRYLNRDPDADGLAFWANELTSGRKTQADLDYAFALSGEYQDSIKAADRAAAQAQIQQLQATIAQLSNTTAGQPSAAVQAQIAQLQTQLAQAQAAATGTASTGEGFFDKITHWVSQNKLLAAGVAGGVLLLLSESGTGGRRR